MKNRMTTANSVLWASAIIAAALVQAPTFLTLFLLPSLAVGAILAARNERRGLEPAAAGGCRQS